MKAQQMYDLREEFAYCSGMELHHFFDSIGLGMSPSGRVNVDTEAARNFMIAGVERQYVPDSFGKSPVGDEWRNAALAAIKAA